MNSPGDIQEAAEAFYGLLNVPAVRNVSYEALVAWLCDKVNALLKDDFAALIQLLYRLDISEEKLRYFLSVNNGEMAASIIAKLMIERQLQKIETRRLFKRSDDIAEDEKW